MQDGLKRVVNFLSGRVVIRLAERNRLQPLPLVFPQQVRNVFVAAAHGLILPRRGYNKPRCTRAACCPSPILTTRRLIPSSTPPTNSSRDWRKAVSRAARC